MDELLDNAPCGFLTFTDDRVIVLANTTLREWLGYPPNELQGHPLETILPAASRIFYQTHFFPLLKLHGKVEEIYLSLRSLHGEELPVLVNAVRRQRQGVWVNDCIVVMIQQRNEYENEILRARRTAEEAHRQKNEVLIALEQALSVLEAQKTELAAMNVRLRQAMTETHHRVKNNLQVIAALIDVQRDEDRESVPMGELVRLGSNVRALGVIHDILTQEARAGSESETLSARTLLERLLSALQLTTGDRRLIATLEDAPLRGRQATSLALVVNEVIANALKHGTGDITIDFLITEETVRLVVSDDGPGFAPDFSILTASNTGLELIENIVAWDLRGNITYQNREEGGARVIVTFPASY